MSQPARRNNALMKAGNTRLIDLYTPTSGSIPVLTEDNPGVILKTIAGNEYVYAQAGVAHVEGDAVMWDSNIGTDTASGAQAITGNTITLVTGGLTANALVGHYVVVQGSGASSGDIYRILSNTATVLTVDRLLDNAIADTKSLRFLGLRSAMTTDLTDILEGLAIVPMAALQWGWFQFRGRGIARVDLTTNGTVRVATTTLYTDLVCGTSDGVLTTGSGTNPLTAPEAYVLSRSRARSMTAQVAEANTRKIPVALFCDPPAIWG